MSSAWFVEAGEAKRDIYDSFEEALHAFLVLIMEVGVEDAILRWSA